LAGNTQSITGHQSNIVPGGYLSALLDIGILGADGSQFAMTCAPNEVIIGSAFTASHRCKMSLYLQFLDVSGASLLNVESPLQNATDDLTNVLAEPYFRRPSVKATSPAGTKSVRMVIRKYNTESGAESYYWIAAPMLERASANQQGPSLYQPGPASNTRQLGFTGALDATYGASWLGNVTQRPPNLAGLVGTEPIRNTDIGIAAGLFNNPGAAGHGLEVANDYLDLQADLAGVGGRGRVLLRKGLGSTPISTVALPESVQNVALGPAIADAATRANLSNVVGAGTLAGKNFADLDNDVVEGTNFKRLPAGEKTRLATMETGATLGATPAQVAATAAAATTAAWAGVTGAGRPQDNADVTLLSQILIDVPSPNKTIACDYQGAVTGAYPTFKPAVTRGGLSIKTDAIVTYTATKLTDATAGADGGTITTDFLAGSPTKGDVAAASITASKLSFLLTVLVNGAVVGTKICTLEKALAAPPVSSGGGGAAAKSYTAAAQGQVSTATDVVCVAASQITVASGEKIYCSGQLTYEVSPQNSSGGGQRSANFKAQYSSDGVSWTTLGSIINGTPATNNFSVTETGYADMSRNAVVTPAVYYVRIVWATTTTGKTLYLNGDLITFEAKV
jgi:hypothetical protein